MVALTRLWAFDELSARPAGIGQPPWDSHGADDYLPAASTQGENETEPVAEQTMGPLLVWAIRTVELADDILAAWAERQRLIGTARASTDSPATEAALRAYFTPLITARAPVPTVTHMGKTALASSYISGLTGASRNQIKRFARRERLHAAAALRPGPCPLGVPVTGRIAGKPWREAVDYYETPNLMRHLGTAAFLVCSYLTGMRPGEKRAELHWMQHSSRPNTSKPAGQTIISDQLAS